MEIFFTFIGFVVLIVFLIRHSDRINRLERKIESLQAVKPVQQATTAQVPYTVDPNSRIIENVSIQPENLPKYDFPSTTTQIPEEHEEQNMGKILGRVGIIALLLGISFFLKYAFDNDWIGPEGRVMLGLVAGAGMMGVGQVMRKKYLLYSDILIGGGMGILYLSIFSAFSFFGLISSGTAFFFMAIVTALGFVMSIVNATMELSVVAILGGFLTPFLIGYHGGDTFTLLFYTTILNLGILGISFFRKWPQIVYLGFLGTVISYIIWYEKLTGSNEIIWGVFFFALVNFLLFISATITRNIKAKISAVYEDYFLLVANTALFSGFVYDLLSPAYSKYSLAFGAVLMAIFYMVLAMLANKSNPMDKPLNFFLAGTGAVFLTLAVPLAFDGSWITVAWLVESLIIYITASMMSNRSFQVMGAIVYAVGGLRFLMVDAFSIPVRDFIPITNKAFALAVLLILISYAIAFIYKRYGSVTLEIQKHGIIVFTILAHIFTIFAISSQIIMYYNLQISLTDSGTIENSLQNTSNTTVSIFWALYAIMLLLIGFMRREVGARRLGLVLLSITAVKVFIDLWSLGEVYRIVSSIAFGVVALGASFLYIKYKDRINEVL